MTPETVEGRAEIEARITAVTALVDAAAQSDGVGPLSEQVLLNLASEAVRHLDAGLPDAYGQYDPRTGSGELVVAPATRGHGLGTHLIESILVNAPEARLWAHGDLPAARHVARRLALRKVRELLRLDLPLDTNRPAHPTPAGLRLRPFTSSDTDAWLELNGRAFAHHPEQGGWTRADLADRFAQDWFVPDDLLLAELDGIPGGGPIGFAWLKIEGAVGEIYVLAVDPALHGRGLGRALTEEALGHLARRGVRTARLYVEADNEPALRAYRGAGFTIRTRDVQYAS